MTTRRIVFMGSPDFAVPSLDILLQHRYHVAGVITAPDKPAGRGMKQQPSAIKKFSLEQKLNILQPVKLKDESFLHQLHVLKPDLAIVVAFRMLPQVVWQLPPLGTVNLHGSLLPQYRGAAPINWAIMNGERETGVTTFFLRHEIDTGKIIFQERMSIGENETAGELHDRMKLVGAALVLKTVQAIEQRNYPQTDQPNFPELKIAPKIFPHDCRINWQRDVTTIYNQIRGLSPVPAAFTLLNEKVLKIFSAKPVYEMAQLEPGVVDSDGANYLRFAAADGFLEVLELQMEGKKRMNVGEFLRGYRLH